MSAALRCDNPDCDSVGLEPYIGWLTVEPSGPYVQNFDAFEYHFCCWECVGVLALAKADPFAGLEQASGE